MTHKEDIKRLKSIQLELHADFIKVVENSRGSKIKEPEKKKEKGTATQPLD